MHVCVCVCVGSFGVVCVGSLSVQSSRDGSDGLMIVGRFGAAGGLLGMPGGREGGTRAGRDGT